MVSYRDDHGNGIPNGNGNPMGIPWEWDKDYINRGNLVGMGNNLHGNGNGPHSRVN